MVKNTREKTGAGAIQSLNQPSPTKVEADPEGNPLAVWLGQWLMVTSIVEKWHVEDEWWRETPLDRSYFQVVLEDGRNLDLFQDLLTGAWYRQRYD